MAELYRQCWQAGTGAPSEYETRLGDALEAAFTAGHHELPALVDALLRMRNILRAEARNQLKALHAAGIDPLKSSN